MFAYDLQDDKHSVLKGMFWPLIKAKVLCDAKMQHKYYVSSINTYPTKLFIVSNNFNCEAV